MSITPEEPLLSLDSSATSIHNKSVSSGGVSLTQMPFILSISSWISVIAKLTFPRVVFNSSNYDLSTNIRESLPSSSRQSI